VVGLPHLSKSTDTVCSMPGSLQQYLASAALHFSAGEEEGEPLVRGRGEPADPTPSPNSLRSLGRKGEMLVGRGGGSTGWGLPCLLGMLPSEQE
jgi:hypothetical protein